MPNPSYYFTLFKKFQVLGHVPAGTVHGSAGGLAGFNLNNAASAFGSSNRGVLLGATPAASPLWAVLNAKAMGLSSVNVGGVSWPAMPLGSPPPAWNDFQVSAPAPKLVTVFADWINAGKTDDVPNDVIATVPGPIGGALEQGVALFVCSVAGDNGVRPGTVPANFWATSLIFLVDPTTGDSVNPPQLSASSEYYLAAVVGNRGNTGAGSYGSPAGVKVEAAGWVMVWNTGMSPAVQLPALSNLDAASPNGVYELYSLKSGRYDVVGFRLNVQTVFNGLVKAIGESGMDLGGLTPTEWVHAQGAHLCAKVVVRTVDEAWPTFGDTPFTNRRLGQKNLAPFAIDLTVTDPDPNIVWRNFVMGDVFRFASAAARFDERLGAHVLEIRAALQAQKIRLYLAIPRRSFARWVRKDAMKGLKPVDGVKAPFPAHVVLAVDPKENRLEIPALGEEFLAMSLGIEYSPRALKAGRLGEVSVTQRTATPKIDREKRCYQIEPMVAGGFTLEVEAEDAGRMEPRS
jgi:hypothetical protein